MIFLTVGTQFPFDRLVEAVDVWAGRQMQKPDIYGQVGAGKYKPKHFEYIEHLDKGLFDKYIKRASAIISHSGIGTISMALEYDKPLLVLPRLAQYGEVVHDHQVDISKKFEQLGHLLAAYDEKELPEKIQQLNTFVPKPRKAQPEKVAARIKRFLNEYYTIKEERLDK